MEAAVVERHVDVEDVTVFKFTLVGNAMTDYFVDGGADGFWEVAVVEGRWVGLEGLA